MHPHHTHHNQFSKYIAAASIGQQFLFPYFSAQHQIVWKQDTSCLTPLEFNDEPNHRNNCRTYKKITGKYYERKQKNDESRIDPDK
jgi:hypothetical protein